MTHVRGTKTAWVRVRKLGKHRGEKAKARKVNGILTTEEKIVTHVNKRL